VLFTSSPRLCEKREEISKISAPFMKRGNFLEEPVPEGNGLFFEKKRFSRVTGNSWKILISQKEAKSEPI
jgi:hypothetical protein